MHLYIRIKRSRNEGEAGWGVASEGCVRNAWVRQDDGWCGWLEKGCVAGVGCGSRGRVCQG